MNLKLPPVYAPLYRVPEEARKNSPEMFGYEQMRENASRRFYLPVEVAQHVATGIALETPYPDAVKLAVMKQIASEEKITLTQLLIFLSWAARRAQHTGRLCGTRTALKKRQR